MDEIGGKLLDRLPYADGSFRRRIFSGVLFVLILIIFWPGGTSIELDLAVLVGFMDVPLLASLFSLFLFGAAAYAVGLSVEMIGISLFDRLHVRKSDDLMMEKTLSPNGRRFLDRMPDIVKENIKQPLRSGFEVAWRYLENNANENDKKWLRSSYANQKLLMVLMFCVVGILMMLFMSNAFAFIVTILQKADETQELIPIAMSLFFIFVFGALIISYLGVLYITTTRSLVVNAIEYCALLDEPLDHSDGDNPIE